MTETVKQWPRGRRERREREEEMGRVNTVHM